MKKTLFTIMLAVAMTMQAQNDTVVHITMGEYRSLLNRIERLEQTPHTGSEQQSAGVDALSGATPVRGEREMSQDSGVKSQDSIATTQDAPQPSTECNESPKRKGRFTIGGYGEITAKRAFSSNNYLRYQTPEKFVGDQFGEFDLPHVVISLGYDFGKGWSMGTEIEFEHGGTESAVEIEEEEGGEYESEVERGGEVALEQFWLQKTFNQYATLRAGMQIIPVGGLNAHHEPTQFFGVYRPEGEYTILPSTWHEVSLSFMGKAKGWAYQVMFMPGLDSDRFNRTGWVNPGAGSPYEFKIANTFAGAFRVDNTSIEGLRLSLSGYCGNSFRNTLSRSYKELAESEKYKDVRGTVYIGSFDFAYDAHNVILRGSATYGHLDDAKLITQYNMAMRKDSPSSKQWVASDVLAAGVELGYDFFGLNPKLQAKDMRFYVFGRYDYYDSMFRYDGKRDYTYAWCGRHRAAVGINYFPIREVAIKAEFSYGILNKGMRADGSLGKIYNDEPQIALGVVYAGFFRL